MGKKIEIDIGDLSTEEKFGEAILEQIDDAKRDELIAAALTYLLEKKGRYGSEKSALGEAFKRAARDEMHPIIKAELANSSKFKKAVKDATQDAIAELLANKEELAKRVARELADLAIQDKKW